MAQFDSQPLIAQAQLSILKRQNKMWQYYIEPEKTFDIVKAGLSSIEGTNQLRHP